MSVTSPTPDTALRADAPVDTSAADGSTLSTDYPATSGIINEVSTLAPQVVSEAKAGYRTTEFWLVVAAGVLTSLGTLPLPDHVKGIVAAGLAGIYALSRGLAKRGVPNVS